MSIRIADIASQLYLQDGIWRSNGSAKYSYPEAGHDTCVEIEDRSFWFIHRNRCIIKTLDNFALPGLILDIGGGNGAVAAAVHASGREAILLEPGISGAQHARERGLSNIICSTLEDAGFISGTIPNAGLFDVLEHIEHHDEFLLNIRELLMSDGRLFLTVPAYHILWSRDDTYAGHFRRYTTRTLHSLLRKCGYIVDYMSYFFSILPVPIFLGRTVPSALGFHRSPGSKVKLNREHVIKSNVLSAVLDKFWKWEISRMQSKETIPVGSSIIAAARKQ